MKMSFKTLRKKYPCFTYQKYEYRIRGKNLEIKFRFLLEPDIRFAPRITIENIDLKRFSHIPKPVLDNLVFHLGLAEIPSYWKCAVSPQIVIEAGPLDTSQIAFWKNLLREGLGEFFYRNKIPVGKNFFTITAAKLSNTPSRFTQHSSKDRFLVPVGGGKDSLVTLEILKKAKKEIRPIILGNVPAAYKASAAATRVAPIAVGRNIDPKLLELNRKGYLNGHTPFSAYLAFLEALCAALFGCNKIAASQERSANEENIRWRGRNINHQYSKSFDFEKKFRAYSKQYLSTTIDYFSVLRPLYELQIAGIFAKFSRYLNVFKSCNVNLKKNSWCGNCPKCLSTWLLLAPFVDEKKLVKAFGKNLLNDKTLWHHIPAFLGISGPRPFDCIGTTRETRAALCLAAEKYRHGKKKLPILLERFVRAHGNKCSTHDTARVLTSWDSTHFVPHDLQTALKKALKRL